MKRAHLLFVVAMAAPSAAFGYALLSAGWIRQDQVNVFFVSNIIHNSAAGGLSWADSTGPTLSEVIAAADRVAQHWNSSARVNTAIRISPTTSFVQDIVACPVFPLNPSFSCQHGGYPWDPPKHSIAVRPLAWWQPPGINAQSLCDGNWSNNCDIIFFSNVGSWRFNGDTLNSLGLQTTSRSFQTVLAHEFGHTYGLGDLVGGPCDLDGDYAPLMCSGAMAWQRVSPDDFDGTNAKYTRVQRESRFMGFTLGQNAGSFGPLTEDVMAAGFSMPSVNKPRISCHPGGGWPDCVVATTNTAKQIILNTVTLGGDRVTWSREHGPLNLGNTLSTTHDADVAFSGATDPPTNAMVAFLRYDTDRSVLFSWARWNLSNNAVLSGNFSVVARVPPRVTWNRLINRYVYVMGAADRGSFRVSVASNIDGTAWLSPQTVFLSGSTNEYYGEFDVTCPTHQTSLPDCYVVLHSNSTVGQAANRTQKFHGCRFTPNANGTVTVPPSNCWQMDAESRLASSMSDAWALTASGGIIGTTVMSGSYFFPETNGNTMVGASISTPPFFSMANKRIFDIPFQQSSPPPKSSFGGVSCDYGEYPERVVCLQPKESAPW